MKQKAFFINFKGLSVKQITQIFSEGESPTLIQKVQKFSLGNIIVTTSKITNCNNNSYSVNTPFFQAFIVPKLFTLFKTFV